AAHGRGGGSVRSQPAAWGALLRSHLGPADRSDPARCPHVRRQLVDHSAGGKGCFMPILMVTDSPEDWPFDSTSVQVVDPETYLIDPAYNEMRSVKVFNICRSYRYQSLGYYVSLLAEARGHKPIPSITTIQDMKST